MTYNKWPSPHGHAIASDKTDKMPAPADGLLPCPFCGGTDIHEPENVHAFWTICNDCGCEVDTRKTRCEARQFWNTRAQPQSVAVVDVTRLRKALSEATSILEGAGYVVQVAEYKEILEETE